MIPIHLFTLLTLAVIGQASVLPSPGENSDAVTAMVNICNLGEVGVATEEMCSLGGCAATFASVVSHDCSHTLGMSNGDKVCANDYSCRWMVSCSGGNPNQVTNGSQRYAECYKPGRTFCAFSSGITTIYINVEVCCRPV